MLSAAFDNCNLLILQNHLITTYFPHNFHDLDWELMNKMFIFPFKHIKLRVAFFFMQIFSEVLIDVFVLRNSLSVSEHCLNSYFCLLYI